MIKDGIAQALDIVRVELLAVCVIFYFLQGHVLFVLHWKAILKHVNRQPEIPGVVFPAMNEELSKSPPDLVN